MTIKVIKEIYLKPSKECKAELSAITYQKILDHMNNIKIKTLSLEKLQRLFAHYFKQIPVSLIKELQKNDKKDEHHVVQKEKESKRKS
jgi:hypothetical protein